MLRFTFLGAVLGAALFALPAYSADVVVTTPAPVVRYHSPAPRYYVYPSAYYYRRYPAYYYGRYAYPGFYPGFGFHYGPRRPWRGGVGFGFRF